ncbi:hypothetical protein BHE74_00020114 [Ensete ventricosum]|nr:hypothetical protein BHE74_00020114 [Ensete ventricosum]
MKSQGCVRQKPAAPVSHVAHSPTQGTWSASVLLVVTYPISLTWSVAVAAAAARKGQCNKVVCVGRTRDDAHRKCGRFLHRTLRPSLSMSCVVRPLARTKQRKLAPWRLEIGSRAELWHPWQKNCS